LVTRAIVAASALLVPIFIVLYWLAIPRNTWIFVAAVQLGLTALGVIGVWGVRRMSVTVTAHKLSSRNLLGRMTTFGRSDIASAVFVDLYQSGTLDSLPHLYLLDSAGDVLMRLRGQIWPRSTLENMIDTLGVSVARPPDPLTMTELARLWPKLVHQWSRRIARLCI
jgi:hypothetical protein